VDLVGARLVAIYEAGRRFKLDTALVKTLSGSDPIKARTLHEKPIEFRPTFLIWLATDTRPEVPEDDAAFYERLCELPFNVYLSPEERDPGVRERLKQPEHGSAVLAWAWRGLDAYRKAGRLVRPRAVEEAGKAFREAMDPVRPFLAEACVFNRDAWVRAEDLRVEYEKWCKENGERPVSGKRMGEALRKAECSPAKRSEVRGWSGVGLLASTAGASGLGMREPGGDDGIPF
jgi:putative DNA primase/helicase